MRVAFGPVDLLLLGMLLGAFLTLVVLQVVAEWSDILNEFNHRVTRRTPWRFVRRHRPPLMWPVSYAVLRLWLLVRPQAPKPVQQHNTRHRGHSTARGTLGVQRGNTAAAGGRQSGAVEKEAHQGHTCRHRSGRSATA